MKTMSILFSIVSPWIYFVLSLEGLSAAETVKFLLTSGKQVEGEIFDQDQTTIWIRMRDGETMGILRSKIQQMDGGEGNKGGNLGKSPVQAPAKADPGKREGMVSRSEKPGSKPERKIKEEVFPFPPEKEGEANEAKEVWEKLKDLAHSSREKRRAAVEKAKELGFRAMPVLGGVLGQIKTLGSDARMGALRALAELGPLDQQCALAVGWSAMMDPDREVRREAARTIRKLKEDRALNYVLGFSISENRSYQVAAAQALREIDDDRAFAYLAANVTPPKVSGFSPTDNRPSEVREVKIPGLGPMGGSLPIFLPTQEVVGTAENLTCPAAEALKIIAGKDLGNLPGVWMNWLNEKAGSLSREELEKAYSNRSMINRMGSPQATGK